MNFELASDIHLRYFNDLGDDFFDPQSSILAVVGDVCECHQLVPGFRIFERMSETWEHVLYVLGNHEFYGATLSNSMISYVKRVLKPLKNITVLEKESIQIMDTLFVGTTLWSGMENRNPVVENACRQAISDYTYIRMSDQRGFGRAIQPLDTVNQFTKNVKFLRKTLQSVDSSVVVLTHHAPSYLSVSESFKGSLYNGAFVSDLDNLILDHQQIRVWAHGHVHSEHNYRLGDCRIVCHPLGYRRELYRDSRDYRPLLVEV